MSANVSIVAASRDLEATAFRGWLIDLDGTLYHALPVRLAMAAELLLGGWSAIGPLQAFRRDQEALRREAIDCVSSPYALQLERTAQHLGIEATALERVVSEWMIRRPGKWLRMFRRQSLLAEIADFRRQGGRTALVSDYPAREKLKALGAVDLFDVVVANGEPGGPSRLKPCPDGYLQAAAALELRPAECLILGDRLEVDGQAAERAGIAFRQIGPG